MRVTRGFMRIPRIDKKPRANMVEFLETLIEKSRDQFEHAASRICMITIKIAFEEIEKILSSDIDDGSKLNKLRNYVKERLEIATKCLDERDNSD